MIGILKIPPLFLVFACATTALAKPTCRCLSSEPCWPSQSAFRTLSSQLSQPLIQPVPPASPCYPPSNPSNPSVCAEVQNKTHDGRWRSDLPGALQSTNFETYIFKNGSIDACYVNVTATKEARCGQGSIPVIGVDVRTVEDAQAAVRFAREYNLRMVIKNTGHDFLGRSTARGAFQVWTHNLKNISYEEKFVPVGGLPAQTYKGLTLGAGVQWYEAYDAAHTHDRVVVGGISAGGSVGAAGGWVQGGGHSFLSTRHGLGVDNALQFTVVTADGKYLTVNEHQHSDLFWALRGGGGGTFALVLSVTYKTHDPVPITSMLLGTNFTTVESAKSVLTGFARLLPVLSDLGWGGYFSASSGDLSGILFATNTSQAEANKTLTPFIELTRNYTQDIELTYQDFKDFYDYYIHDFAGEQVNGYNVEFGSRLISRKIAEESPEKVADVICAIDGLSINFIAGGAVSRFDPGSVGLNPNWRKAIAQMNAGAGWEDGTPFSVIQASRQQVIKNIDVLDTISANSASYFNEASLYEKDFKKSFFGDHYGKLKKIKMKYDPSYLFIVPSGVGSEDWDGSLNCPTGELG